jgi:hypothetical protein
VNTTGSANIFSSLFGNLPQQQQQQHNQQFSSAVGSHNQPFSQSTTFESLLCNDVKSQQQSFNMPQQNLV